MRDYLLGLGVVPVCPDAFDRVLRFVQTSRDVLAEGERLHAQCRQRLKRSSNFAAQDGQEPHSRRQISKRAVDEPFVIHFMRACMAVMSPKEGIWPSF